MIAEDREAQRAFHLFKDFNAAIGELIRPPGREEAFSYKVSIEEHQIGIQAVYVIHNVADEERLSVFRVVKIGNLDDPETAKFVRKAIQAYAVALDADFVAGNLGGIKWNANDGYSRSLEKGATGDPFSNFSLLDGNVHLPMITT